MKIDENDLAYHPKTEPDDYELKYRYSYEGADAYRCQSRLQKQEYWEKVKYARKRLFDYYGSACHFFKAAHADLDRIKRMEPDEF